MINPKNNIEDNKEVSFIPMTLISDGFSNKHSYEVRLWGEVKKGFTHFQEGDIGIAKITPCFENRKSVIFSNLVNEVGAGTTELHILRPFAYSEIKKYIYWFINTESFIQRGISHFSGAVGQQRVGKDILENTLLPLPPLSEQRRIVEKIEELLALVDDLETNKTDLQSYIKQAKSKVLEMAVRGELVPQNPEDEPASVLLERIKKEQKSSKSKGKTTAHNTHYEEELPFDIPENWAWCRLGEIANIKTGKKDANYGGKEGKYPFFTCALLPIRCNIFSFDLEAILLPGNGANVGEVFYFKGKFEAYQRTYVLDFEIENIRYFYYVLKALWKKSIIGKQFGSATNYIRLSNIEELLIPLPPITEQKRIVEKIEEIFSELEFIEEALI